MTMRELDEEGKFYTKTFYSQGGITEFLEMLDSNAGRNPLIPKPIYVNVLDAVTNVAVEVSLDL